MLDELKSLIKSLFVWSHRPVAKLDGDMLRYIQGGRIPWSAGYAAYRAHTVSEILTNEEMMLRFRNERSLPPGYGVGLDERCVEYLWLLSRLEPGPERILDAGSALNHNLILDQTLLQDKTIHILTLAPERNCFWHRGISYLYVDLRDIPIRDNYYDTVVCCSTLEHVGLDNTWFIHSEAHAEKRPDDYLGAVAEIRRVLKPGGKLLLTVPYGRYRNFGTFQQFDEHLVNQVITAFEPAAVEQTYFGYTPDGWDFSTGEACADAEYVEWTALPPGLRLAAFPNHPDRAAAARAVACLLLLKPA